MMIEGGIFGEHGNGIVVFIIIFILFFMFMFGFTVGVMI